MTVRIAVSGKGGVGKSTVVCGIVKFLINQNKTPILVVDADPNSNLAECLGVSYQYTIADVREDLRDSSKIPTSFSKTEYINLKLQEALFENKYFDFIAMGYPEGKECYCFVNELLRNFLSNLTKNYKFVVIDTEAGMEHLSRRTTDNLDYLLVITTPAKVSIDTAGKIIKLAEKLKLRILNKKVILNMYENEIFDKNSLKFDAFLPKDKEIELCSQRGEILLNKIENTFFYEKLIDFLNLLLKGEIDEQKC